MSAILLTFAGIFLLIPVISVVYIYVVRRKITKYMDTVPCPPCLPLIGHIADIRKFQTSLQWLQFLATTYGDFIRIQIGPFYSGLIVSNYQFVEFVLTSNKLIAKSDLGYKFLKPWLGTGLLIASVEKWRRHRKLITPTFHFKSLEGYLQVFDESGDILMERLHKNCTSKPFDIVPYMSMCLQDIICETAMGIKVNAQKSGNSSYIRSVKTMCEIIINRSWSPVKFWDPLFVLTKDFYRQKKALNILHSYTYNVIRTRQELRNANASAPDGQTAERESPPGRRKQMFLDLLLEANEIDQVLTIDDMRKEVDTFMFGGHDTTSTALCFAVYSLAKHQDIQEKVYQEQIDLFGENLVKPSVTQEDLKNMKYLELVIKETLRLYPSVPYYARQTTEDVQFDGKIIPAGIDIMINAFALHRNPEYFPNPEEFQPKRFETVIGRPPLCYIPFSAGPRNCIGQKYAMLAMKSVLSKIVREFHIFPSMPDEPLILESNMVLQSLNGIKIRLRER